VSSKISLRCFGLAWRRDGAAAVVGAFAPATVVGLVLMIDDAIGRIRKWGKSAGVLTGIEADARRWLELGCQFVAVGVDATILARERENLRSRF